MRTVVYKPYFKGGADYEKETALKDRLQAENLIGKEYKEVKELIKEWEEVNDIESETIKKILKGDVTDSEEEEGEDGKKKKTGKMIILTDLDEIKSLITLYVYCIRF